MQKQLGQQAAAPDYSDCSGHPADPDLRIRILAHWPGRAALIYGSDVSHGIIDV
jgi:hypothetical protein